MSQRTSEDARTRERVLRAVLDHGPINASRLARSMSLTPAAIRRHLDALCDGGQIEVRELAGQKAGRGRPARHYVVTSQGHAAISHSYDDLAIDALDYLSEQAGPEAVTEFARRRTAELAEQLKSERKPDSVVARSRELAGALTREGFAASATPVAAGTPLEAMQLCQGHCPIQQVAEKHPEFCETELEMFSEYLGVDVRRLSTLANGDHVCTTHIPTSELNRPLIDDNGTDRNQGGSR